MTQLAFIRLSAMPQVGGPDASPARALALLQSMVDGPRHEYWPDAPPPLDLRSMASPALVGWRQVTDVYLLGLAVERGASVATFDVRRLAEAEKLGRYVEWIGPSAAAHEPVTKYSARRRAR